MRICGLAAAAFCGGVVCVAFAETVDVPSGQTVKRTVALTENLVKTGEGTYVLSVASDGFSGTIDVQGGVLEMANTEGIGSAESLTVANGAQFKVSAVKGKLFPVTHFTIAGSGPDGNGAIYTTEIKQCERLMNGRLTLTADSTMTFSGYFQATGRDDKLSSMGAVWDFGGHDLTLVTPKGLELYSGLVFENPGNIIMKGQMTVSRSPNFGGSAENSFIFSESGCTLNLYCIGKAFPWTIDVREDGKVVSSKVDHPEREFMYLNGSVKLSPGKRLTFSVKEGLVNEMYVGGAILGGGDGASIQVDEGGQLFVTNNANDFVADLLVKGNANLIFASKAAFPKGGNVEIRGTIGSRKATVAFDMSPGGWTAEEVHALMDAMNVVTWTGGDYFSEVPSVYVPAGVECVDETDIAEGRTIRMCGGGTYVLKGSVPESVTLRNDGDGHLVVTPNDKASKPSSMKFFTGAGEIQLKDAGTVTVDVNKSKYVQVYSGIKEAIGRVAIEGETSLQSISTNCGDRAFYPHIIAESNYEVKKRGLSIFELRDGAVMDAIVEVGALSGSVLSAFYVRGGTYTMPFASGETIYFGNVSRGYFEISGGTANFDSRLFMSRNRMDASKGDNIGYACTDAPASGFVVRGGECRFVNRRDIVVGLNGDAFYYQDGGTFTIDGNVLSVNAPLSWEDDQLYKWTGGVASVSIDGGRMSVASDIVLGGRTNGTAYLNVNSGGVLSAAKVRCNVPGQDYRKSLVGFNGGVFKAIGSGTVLPSGSGAPNRVTVYRDGITFDTAGYDIAVSVPLEGATGLGVTGLTIPENMPTNGYLGPHMVLMKGGSGAGALAVLDVNTTNNTLRGVRVVSPGFGYAAGDEITALAKDGSYVDKDGVRRFGEYRCNVALGDLSGGGLTKRGAGSLTLNAATTYTGATTVEEGTLVFGVENALGNPKIVCRGGAVATADGVAYPDGLEFDASGLTDEHARYVIARNWTGGTGCVKNLADRFTAKVRGNNLTVSRDYGLTVVVR